MKRSVRTQEFLEQACQALSAAAETTRDHNEAVVLREMYEKLALLTLAGEFVKQSET